MAEYTLKQINHKARHNPEKFITECENVYHAQVAYVAEHVAANSKQKPIVLLNGPSSSGKTTTTDRLKKELSKHGIHAEMISMDDYYRTVGSYEIPMDEENGVVDYESPECMDLPLLSDHLTRLAEGEEIQIPRFDFEIRTSKPNAKALRLDPDEVVIIEGIHAFNPVIMGDLAHNATGVYLSVASAVVSEEGIKLEPSMLRFLRRAMRDSLFRNSPVEETIAQWKSVRRGERLYIGPYRGQADVTVDTFLPYELCILANKLKKMLLDEKETLLKAGLSPVFEIMNAVSPIAYESYIPEASVLHEFIG